MAKKPRKKIMVREALAQGREMLSKRGQVTTTAQKRDGFILGMVIGVGLVAGSMVMAYQINR